MAYIGFGPLNTFSPVPSKDSFTGDGSTTTFDLENEVVFGGENALEVFVDNVRQEPGTGKAYTLDLDGNLKNKRITFSAAPASGAAIYVINDKTSNTTIISPTDLNGVEFILDADQDTSITADTDDRIDFKLNGTDHIQLGTSSGDTTIKIATDAKDLQFLQADGRNILEINDAGYVALGNGATGSGQLRIYEDTDNGTNYSAFQVGTQSADITYTLPTADGTSGFQLTTDGSGTLSWAAAQIALANDGNNRIVTGTGSAGLNAEANLTYDGSTLAVTGAVTVSTDVTIQDDLILDSDAAVLSFGEDNEITLTHVADTGLLLNTASVIQFRDSAINIGSPADGDLDINADDEIELNSTLIDINGAVEISGTLAQVGVATFTAIPIFSAGINVSGGTIAGTVATATQNSITTMTGLVTTGALDTGSITSGFGTIDTGASAITTTGLISGGSLDIDNVLINGTTIGHTDDTDLITLADGIVTVAGEISVTTLDIGGTNVTSTAAELNILDDATVTTAELNLIDGGTSRGTTAVASGDGILINDGGTMRMTNVDTVSTYFASHTVGGGNIVTTGALGSGSIAAGFGAIDNGTSGIRTNTFTAETSFLPDAQDGAALGTTSLQFSDLFLADGAVIGLGDDNEVTLTHVADTGITLNSTNKLMFNDASQFIQGASATVLDIAATDEIELTATLIEVVGNATVSGTLGVTGVLTADAGVAVDNITIDGTEIDLSSGDLTVDVAGDIILDAGGGNIKVSVATTQILDIANSSSDVIIKPVVDAKDIIFQQRDGTSILEINDGAYARFTAAACCTRGNINRRFNCHMECINSKCCKSDIKVVIEQSDLLQAELQVRLYQY